MNRNKFKPRNAGLRQMASHIREQGQRGDKILAHINPEEAHYLAETRGMDINPHTGLPQYGRNPLRRLEKALRPVTKKVLPVAGAVLGNMIVPGLGGSVIGGGIGGALGNRKDPLRGAMIGAAMGGVGHYAFGSGTTPEWMSKFGEKIGFTGGAEATKHLGNIGTKEVVKKTATGGWGDKLMDLMKDNPVQTGLGAATIFGTLLSKEKKRKGESGHDQGSLSDVLANNQRIMATHDAPHRTPKPMNRRGVTYTPEQWFGTSAELPYFEETNPTPQYADGGHVERYGHPMEHEYSYAHGGYIDGDSGGQDDDVEIEMQPGSYVMDATTVSLLGDGNSRRGASTLKSWEDKALASGIVNDRDYGHSHHVKALVSPGERVIRADTVTKIGKGSNDKGAKMLDKFRNRVRQHKGVKKFLPPKSKPISSYLKER